MPNPITLRVAINIFFLVNAFSQIIAQPRYTFQRIDISSGLQNNTVNSIVQDNQGFVWIGTNKGVQRFDMYAFSNFPEFNLNSKVFIDRAGEVWVISENGVTVLDIKNKSSFHVPILMNDEEMVTLREYKIFEDSLGRIWLFARLPDASPTIWYFLLYNANKKQFRQPVSGLQEEVESIGNGINANDGNLWLASSHGLVYYDVKRNVYYNSKNNPLNIPLLNKKEFAESILLLKSDKEGNLIIITWGARPVFYFVKKDQSLLREMDLPILRNVNNDIGEVRDILVDKNNTIWLAGEALQKINIANGTYEIVQLPEDITIINSISEDREGNIWLGTYRGILLIDPDQRVQYKYNQYPGEPVYKRETVCLFKTWDDIILASGWNGSGLFFYDQNLNAIEGIDGFTKQDFQDIKTFPAWKIIEDSEKNIWIGAQHGYLVKIDRRRKKITRFKDPAFDSRTIRDICEDPLGNIWFSTQNASIVRWVKRDEQFIKFNNKDDIGGFVFFHLDGNDLWASGGSFLLKIDPSTGKVVNKYHDELKAFGKPSIVLSKVIESSDEKLVLGSSRGLIEFNKKKQSFHLKEMAGILSAEAMSIDNYLFALDDGSIVEYNSGLMNYLEKGNTYNFNSSIKLKNGVVVFGGEIALTIVKPRDQQILKTPILPPLFSSIQALNKELNVDSLLINGLNLNYYENNFSITYSALNFQESEDIDYYYRINTKDKEFINVKHQRTITYAQLPHGEYMIEIFYVLPDGRRSPVTALKVNILPPVWKQTWFLLISVIIVCGVIFIFYWIRLSKKKALAKVREKISRDLHDDMGSNLSSINILSSVAQSAMSKPDSDVKVGDILNRISDLSIQAMESVDEIVWSLNPLHDSFEEIVARMRLLGGEMLENQNINFMFSMEGDPSRCNLPIDRRNDFYMIYKESITNITKYAKCKNVYASLLINKHKITLIITDDGVGFNLNSSSGGNGIQNIRARAKSLKSNLNIESKVNTGTRIELHVPIFSGLLN